MSYSYEKEKPELFTEEGVEMLIKMRDRAKSLLAQAGAVRADKIMGAVSSERSSWAMMAALDYMVEKGELRRVTAERDTWGHHQVFVAEDEPCE